MARNINYKQLEYERSTELQTMLKEKLAARAKESTADFHLRHNVLKLVVQSEYEDAQKEIEKYIDARSDYPSFEYRAVPHVRHCRDIINAIRTKRNMPGMSGLPISKQQELFDKVGEHFDELKEQLKRIQITEKEVKLNDLRATVWVVKALFHCIFLIFVVGFFQEVIFGLAGSMNVVIEDMVNDLVNITFLNF